MTLADVAADFALVTGPEKLELLLHYGEDLPPLPPKYAILRDQGLHLIHECQSPVFLMVEQNENRLVLHADVPREAAIARGWTALLIAVFNGAPYDILNDAPSDLLAELGLASHLSLQRQRGLRAIYRRVRQAD